MQMGYRATYTDVTMLRNSALILLEILYRYTYYISNKISALYTGTDPENLKGGGSWENFDNLSRKSANFTNF